MRVVDGEQQRTLLGRVREQAELALTRPEFLGGSWPRILDTVRDDPVLAPMFQAAYGRVADREAVIDAINSFERTLLTPDSRFDRWLRGDARAITGPERAGYDLFRRIGCAACHQGVNVGGNLFEKVGIFVTIPNKVAEVLRVPSLRNVALTAPYMHDGSLPTLDAVLDHYAAGGSPADPTQDARIRPFRLEARERADLLAFLHALTGRIEPTLLQRP